MGTPTLTLDLDAGPAPDSTTVLAWLGQGHVQTTRRTCARGAFEDLIATFASAHGGLYRDENGVWWTADWEVCLATPADRNVADLLTKFATQLGFDA